MNEDGFGWQVGARSSGAPSQPPAMLHSSVSFTRGTSRLTENKKIKKDVLKVANVRSFRRTVQQADDERSARTMPCHHRGRSCSKQPSQASQPAQHTIFSILRCEFDQFISCKKRWKKQFASQCHYDIFLLGCNGNETKR